MTANILLLRLAQHCLQLERVLRQRGTSGPDADSEKRALLWWAGRLEKRFSTSAVKLADIEDLLKREIPARLAGRVEDVSAIDDVFMATFALPASVDDRNAEWRIWARDWLNGHVDSALLHQAAGEALAFTNRQPAIAAKDSGSQQEWALWRQYLAASSDIVTRLPLKDAGEQLRFCARCFYASASERITTGLPSVWPMFDDHCPCGGLWWRIQHGTDRTDRQIRPQSRDDAL
ncbi:hypothetical protein THASP1DRAFT_32344 [Thamnocephalis sphaerospora]|uniref:Uncharacterized protein n=1 Tax=Thamnocephalis sphaerospora TaxID=78915 RepID=A0A4P9XJA1_9FUNG|nr:hypothetical protein THASP1DRAFT_32344 [Thamnocephalis sphaerospora]|eukprot:RKP05827.1 hypothetical protein THASP1DRAFT_32344 [Thamnocephalis sphaerospora]